MCTCSTVDQKCKILSKIIHACTGNSYEKLDFKRLPFHLMLGSLRADKTLTYLSNEDPGGGPGRVVGVCGRGTPVEVWSRCPGQGRHRPCRPLECNNHSGIYTSVDLSSFSQEGRRISTIYYQKHHKVNIAEISQTGFDAGYFPIDGIPLIAILHNTLLTQ